MESFLKNIYLKIKKPLFFSAFFLCLNISASEKYYVVKKGDTLSTILQSEKLFPIYGQKGSIEKTIHLNKILQASAGKYILPEMRILLPPIKEVAKEEVAVCKPAVIENKVLEIPALPVATEPEIINRTPGESFVQSFYWGVSLITNWRFLSAKDENVYRSSQVQALSGQNYGASLLYGMHFEEGLDIYSKLLLEKAEFSNDSTINLLENKFILSRFSAGIVLDKKYILEVSMSDQLFLTSPSSSKVEIKKIALPELSASYHKHFYQFKNADLAYKITGRTFMPRSSATVKSSFSYGAGAAIEAKLNNQAFDIGYDLNILKAPGNSTNSHNIYWNYTWETM